MKTYLFLVTMLLLAMGCKKDPAIPPHVIEIRLASVTNEVLSVTYADSVNHKTVPVKIRPFIIDGLPDDGYAYSLSTQSFVSKYLWDACSKGTRDFELHFSSNGQTENHLLHVNFRWLVGGGFEINGATVDGHDLITLPPSDSSRYGHYMTGFTYDR